MDKAVSSIINSEADKILARYSTRYTAAVRDYVVNTLISQIGQRISLTLYADDEKNIERKLTIDDNPCSHISLSHLRFYNNLILDLGSLDVVKGRPLNVPLQINRSLILTPANNLDEHIRCIQILHDDLLKFHALPDDIRLAEIDCVCSFIASAAIFAKITIPRLTHWILSIRFHDIHLGPDYINRQIPDTDAFYRFFLPYPSNIYFMRCILFYSKKYKLLNKSKPSWADDYVFQPAAFNIKTITSTFNTWLLSRLKAHGLSLNTRFSVSNFFKAVQAASIIDLTPSHRSANRVPPFIIATQSGEIGCYAYRNIHFPEFLGENFFPEHRYKAKAGAVKRDEKYTTLFKSFIHKIRNIRRSLLSETDSYPRRREFINSLLDLLKNAGADLTSDDAFNIELYIGWLKLRMLEKNDRARDEYLDVKSMNDQAPMVETLIFHLSGAGLIFDISNEVFDDIKRMHVYPKYATPNVHGVINNFTDFLREAALERGRRDFDWSPDSGKEDLPSLKPFITPKTFRTTLQRFEEKFTRYTKKLKRAEQRERRIRSARHKAKVLAMMTELAYYTGLRIEECALLQIKDVIFDGVFVLRIRKTKTDNGDRNIPLSYLAPTEFVKRFVDFWKERKKIAPLEGLIFVQLDGSLWDTSHASKEVRSVFLECGITGMTFHNLRDSFASLLLLKWLAVFHRNLLPNSLPFLSDELFSDENLDKFRRLVLGMGNQRTYQDTITHVMAILAKLMGHGGPVVSLKYYVHIIDWLFYFFSRGNTPDKIEFTCRAAESFLQVTYPSLPDDLKGHGLKSIKTSDFLCMQRVLIKYPKPSRSAGQKKSRNPLKKGR